MLDWVSLVITWFIEHLLSIYCGLIVGCSDLKQYSLLVAQTVKHLPTMRETWVRSLGGENPLEKEMATHSSTLAWKIPWEEPGGLQSMGLQRVGQDWAISLHFTSILFKCLWRPSVLRMLKCSLKKEKGKKSLKATVRGLASVHQYEVTSMITELSSER